MAGLLVTPTARAFTGLALLLLVATLVGTALLWPRSDQGTGLRPGQLQLQTLQAKVISVRVTPCQAPSGTGCRQAGFRLLSGPDRGDRFELDLGGAGPAPEVQVGDRVQVAKNEIPEGIAPPPNEIPPYIFQDFERRSPLVWLALLFAAVVVVLGRWRGALSLLGLAVSLAVVVLFIAPAMLEGRPPLAVGIVGALLVMFVTIALAHGVGPKSLAAALGTAAALVLTIALALLFTELAHLTGFSSEESTILAVQRSISLEGLVLAGIVIGALGVLDDVTVSQASTVMALRRANPGLSLRQLYRAAVEVGRDHVAATVNTLVLAYVGASLPIVLLFTVGGRSFSEAMNLEVVAENVVATLVGSIGLVAAVPITTLLAAILARGMPVRALDEGAHAHVH